MPEKSFSLVIADPRVRDRIPVYLPGYAHPCIRQITG
jgi:hypothetical protein